jgi:hypothetical protein
MAGYMAKFTFALLQRMWIYEQALQKNANFYLGTLERTDSTENNLHENLSFG